MPMSSANRPRNPSVTAKVTAKVSGPGRGANPGPLTPTTSLHKQQRIIGVSRYSKHEGSCPYVPFWRPAPTPMRAETVRPPPQTLGVPAALLGTRTRGALGTHERATEHGVGRSCHASSTTLPGVQRRRTPGRAPASCVLVADEAESGGHGFSARCGYQPSGSAFGCCFRPNWIRCCGAWRPP